MNFKEILDQAMAMLRRRRRVTYSTLRLQFQLDDEQLARGMSSDELSMAFEQVQTLVE
jgi:hypothetical protein